MKKAQTTKSPDLSQSTGKDSNKFPSRKITAYFFILIVMYLIIQSL